jgi:hypothetical protein
MFAKTELFGRFVWNFPISLAKMNFFIFVSTLMLRKKILIRNSPESKKGGFSCRNNSLIKTIGLTHRHFNQLSSPPDLDPAIGSDTNKFRNRGWFLWRMALLNKFSLQLILNTISIKNLSRTLCAVWEIDERLVRIMETASHTLLPWDILPSKNAVHHCTVLYTVPLTQVQNQYRRSL